jgi:hypothetical protein
VEVPRHSVFYSWQSDLPNSTNRGFLENCLERAIKLIGTAAELNLDPALDRDTRGVPGAPDIAETIFAKIEAADVFVADVSFVTPAGSSRPSPNPNVLIELGYAAKALGWERIICVFNKAYGRIEDLPFDIRKRLVRVYELVEGQEKAVARPALVSALATDITAILHQPDREAAKAKSEFLSDLAPEIISVLILGSEIENRLFDPWLTSVRSEFETIADTVRRFAVKGTAIQLGMADDLEHLARALDQVAHLYLHLNSGDELLQLVGVALERARALKDQRIDNVPLSEDSILAVRSLLAETNRELQGLARRAESMMDNARSDELQQAASHLGRRILEVGHHNLSAIAPDLSAELLRIGRPLHLVETMMMFMDGESQRAVVDQINEAARELGLLVERLRTDEK